MSDFLSPEWFSRLNEKLSQAGPVPFEGPVSLYRVVFEFTDAPSDVPHATTFTLTPTGASVASGDHLAADAIVKLAFPDAAALFAGTLESAQALREGRIKVRGDLNGLVSLVGWLQQAHHDATSA
jgi:SCP-2 sterol transfer family